MDAEDLRCRSRQLTIRVITFIGSLPDNFETRDLRRQLFRSAPSVAVNYRAAGRARSRREFIAKLSIVVEEVDEAVFWLELINDVGIYSGPELDAITKEAKELLYIFSASRKTAKENLANHQIPKSLNH